jgi:hypothetical protein
MRTVYEKVTTSRGRGLDLLVELDLALVALSAWATPSASATGSTAMNAWIRMS